MDMRPSLEAYLEKDWRLDVHLALDFTLSNLECTDYRSLHRRSVNDLDMNMY